MLDVLVELDVGSTHWSVPATAKCRIAGVVVKLNAMLYPVVKRPSENQFGNTADHGLWLVFRIFGV